MDFFRANDVFVTRYDWDAPLGRRRPSCRELTNGPTSLSMDFLHLGNLGREEGGRASETFRVDVPDAGGQTELGFKSPIAFDDLRECQHNRIRMLIVFSCVNLLTPILLNINHYCPFKLIHFLVYFRFGEFKLVAFLISLIKSQTVALS